MALIKYYYEYMINDGSFSAAETAYIISLGSFTLGTGPP